MWSHWAEGEAGDLLAPNSAQVVLNPCVCSLDQDGSRRTKSLGRDDNNIKSVWGKHKSYDQGINEGIQKGLRGMQRQNQHCNHRALAVR